MLLKAIESHFLIFGVYVANLGFVARGQGSSSCCVTQTWEILASESSGVVEAPQKLLDPNSFLPLNRSLFPTKRMADGLVLFAAEFDINKGSTLSFIYPPDALVLEEQATLAELMLPGFITCVIDNRGLASS